MRKSVTPDYIVCLEDGMKFKSLKRHLRTHFDMSPEEYRDKWGLPVDYPMVAPNYSATRSRLAKDNGLGQKARDAGRPPLTVAGLLTFFRSPDRRPCGRRSSYRR